MLVHPSSPGARRCHRRRRPPRCPSRARRRRPARPSARRPFAAARPLARLPVGCGHRGTVRSGARGAPGRARSLGRTGGQTSAAVVVPPPVPSLQPPRTPRSAGGGPSGGPSSWTDPSAWSHGAAGAGDVSGRADAVPEPTCTAQGSGLQRAEAGSEARFEVTKADGRGTPRPISAAALSVRLSAAAAPQGATPPPPRQPEVRVTPLRPGTLAVAFVATTAGEHALHVAVRGRPVQGSPFLLRVRPGPAAAALSIAQGSGLSRAEPRHESTFVIIASDAHANRCARGAISSPPRSSPPAVDRPSSNAKWSTARTAPTSACTRRRPTRRRSASSTFVSTMRGSTARRGRRSGARRLPCDASAAPT